MTRIDKAYVNNTDGTGYWTLIVDGKENFDLRFNSEMAAEDYAEDLLLELEREEQESEGEWPYYDTWKEYHDAACN